MKKYIVILAAISFMAACGNNESAKETEGGDTRKKLRYLLLVTILIIRKVLT